ncbi:MAG TPA: PrsW family intramembrane metalloprotease [Terriglobales bacterium]|nr:PrsW family intramembrane metalloprotease [Terriglobales bacterium]
MHCLQCGASNLESHRFCTKCGAALAPASAAAAAPLAVAAVPAGAGMPPPAPAPSHQIHLIDSLKGRIDRLASTEKLEGFSLSEMFSEVFKHRSQEDTEQYFLVGTSHTTPAIQDCPTGWPKPWFFMRMLAFLCLTYAVLDYALHLWPDNLNLIPGLLMMGSLAVPLSTAVLVFEMNTPRNVSFYEVLRLFLIGGVISMLVALFEFEWSPLSWLGSPEAGVIEETAKLLTVVALSRGGSRYKYILNGLLLGAAVGAGFAAFESAGYAFRYLLISKGNYGQMTSVIYLRGFLAPFGHVAWTAIAAAAFWRVRGDASFQLNMLWDKRFLKAMLIPVALHMIWDFPYFPSIFFLKYIALGLVAWYVLFGFVQQGLRQVKKEQLEGLKVQLRQTLTGSLNVKEIQAMLAQAKASQAAENA